MNLLENTKLLWLAEAGRKERTSTVYSFLTKGYDASFKKNGSGEWEANENHLTQTTELNQLYLRGSIAPNENLCAYNGNGENKYFTHPTIAFSSNEAWSYVVAINNNYSNNGIACLRAGDSSTKGFWLSPSYVFKNKNGDSSASFGTSYADIGKNTILAWIADGTGNLSLYRNGGLLSTIAIDTIIDFTHIFNSEITQTVFGKLHYHRIQKGALTATQVIDEVAMIRSWLPEVENVAIGAQEWATSNLDIVCTPQGNVIPEMQLADNVEEITVENDRTFASDTGFWTKGTGVLITAGVASGTDVPDQARVIKRSSVGTIGCWHRFEFEIKNYVTGGVKATDEYTTYGRVEDTNGVKYVYFKAMSSSVGLIAYNISTLDIDNVSFEKVGWAGLGDLYTWLTTVGGYSVADALKECGSWCYNYNDPANGAIYGKLYNWYAIKLLQDDIDAYNVANPTTPWGWRIPGEADYEGLATALGGEAIAGSKMKVSGEDYWNSPNSGATNESGFSGLGAGYRTEAGDFSQLKNRCNYFTIEGDNPRTRGLINSATTFVTENVSEERGNVVRLIKS